jgi:hypothetical protein
MMSRSGNAPETATPVRYFIVNSFGRNADLVNHLHRALSRFWCGTAVDAANVRDAVAQILAKRHTGEVIGQIQFWGHGRAGAMTVGDDELTADSFAPLHPHAVALVRLLPLLRDCAIVSFEGCQTFAGSSGKYFARTAAAFFGRQITVSGHTRLLGYNLDWGSVARLRPGQEPTWPDVDPKDKALKKQRQTVPSDPRGERDA